jgi:hypothetical protein
MQEDFMFQASLDPAPKPKYEQKAQVIRGHGRARIPRLERSSVSLPSQLLPLKAGQQRRELWKLHQDHKLEDYL